MGIFDSFNFFWSHRSWPLLNFSSFSGKCATTLVSGDALFNALARLCTITIFLVMFSCPRVLFHFLGNQRVF